MCRRARPIHIFGTRPIASGLLAVATGWYIVPSAAFAQTDARDTSALSADQIVSAYLERLGLKRLQAEDLAQRLAHVAGTDRVAMAERLGKLYVELLSEESSAEDRRAWEERSRELLRLIPEADTYELRLALNKALYLQAEEAIEKHRLRLATAEEVAEAERTLRTLKPQLEEIGNRANRRVESFKILEEKGELNDVQSEVMADAQRARSQAYYYAGWSAYYLAMLTKSDEAAADALKDFGWLLNSAGSRVASVERLPKELLKYEHIARAAIGCGLCSALRGNDTLALRWFDEIEDAPDLPDAVRVQLFTRRVTVLADSKRWADLERLIRIERKADRSGGGDKLVRLTPTAARLVAVVTLEADKSISKELIEPLSAIALGDLVAQGELAQVLDLVKRYGTAPIGDTGFIVYHVRGLQQYDQAREAHKLELAAPSFIPTSSDSVAASPPDSAPTLTTPDKPAGRPDTIKAYKDAAVLLEGAVSQPDAPSFKTERAQASMYAGLSWYYAGELGKAADRLLATAQIASTKEQASEALWLAVVSLDRAVEAGEAELVKRRDEAAALFLQSDPDSDRAARLIIRRAMTGVLETEESVKILLGVPKDSPMYASSRQHAARLLYTQYRAARGSDREFAAMRFVGVAEEAMALDRRVAVEGNDKDAKEAAERLVTRVRQVLDALLSGSAPDVPRAESALETLRSVATSFKLDLSAHESELIYRRFQIAVAKDDQTAATELGEQLRTRPGPFALAADQLLFRRAVASYQRAKDANGDRVESAREVVRLGSRLIERVENDPSAVKDAQTLTLYQHTSRAAFDVFDAASDTVMRDLSLKLDKVILGVHPSAEEPLRRVARTSESAGDNARALECWRTLMGGLEVGSSSWFEARYESLRLLALSDPARARQVMQQHVVLYPSYGPEPWGAKIKELDSKLPPAPPPAPWSPESPSKDGKKASGSASPTKGGER